MSIADLTYVKSFNLKDWQKIPKLTIKKGPYRAFFYKTTLNYFLFFKNIYLNAIFFEFLERF